MSWLRFKWHERHEDNDEEIIVMHNIDANKMECQACGLKGDKINKCKTKYLHGKPLQKIQIKTRNTGRNEAIWKYKKH